MQCPSVGLLSRLSEGALDAPERAKLEAHLSECDACSAQLAKLATTAFREQTTLAGAPDHTAELGLGSSLPQAPTSYLTRGALLGRYVVLDLLGAGGMGEVYSAIDPELDRRVAVKLVKDQQGTAKATSEGRARLLREAQAMARLSHPNVVAVYDVGVADGRIFLAMELVAGTTLKGWLDEEKPGWRSILHVFLGAGEGLRAAHDGGMVHRDLKPDNILVGKDGRVRVGDFGLARVAGDQDAVARAPQDAALLVDSRSLLASPMTEASVLVGTPAYMAPEQFDGTLADARSDQFSFCVALYEALYGEKPFQGATFAQRLELLRRGEVSPPPPGSRVPAWLRRVVLRGLRVKPEARYGSMMDLLAALRQDTRRARVRNWAVAVAVTGLVAAVVAARQSDARRISQCEAGEALLDGAWDAEAQAGMEKAFLATGRNYASDVWKETRRLLTSYANAWLAARTDACLATWQRKQQSEQVLALRVECLDQRLLELRALTRVLGSASAEVMTSAVEAANHLSSLAPCSDVESLSMTASAPAASVRAGAERVRAQLPVIRALLTTKQASEGRDRAKSAVQEAEALGYLPLQADASLLLGDACYAFNDFEQAESAYLSAHAAGEEANQRTIIAQALVGIMKTDTHQYRHAEAARWARLTEIAIKRVKRNQTLWCDYFLAMGISAWHQGQNDLSTSRLASALEACGKADPPDAQMLGRVHLVLGAAFGAGDRERAHAEYETALRLATQAAGPVHRTVAAALNNLGDAAVAVKRYDEAQQMYERSIETFIQLGGPENGQLFYPLDGMGNLALKRGQFAEAVKLFQRGDQLVTRQHGAEAADRGYSLTGMGEAYLGLGNAADALEQLEHALALIEKAGLKQDFLQARTRFALARALGLSKRSPERAGQLAQKARDEFATSPTKSAELAAVNEWLAAR